VSGEEDGSAGNTLVVILLAIIVVAGVAVGGYAVGHRTEKSSPSVTTTIPPTTLTTVSAPATSSTASSDLPISVATNSAPGIATTSCEVSSDGTTAIALGRFTSDISTQTNPSFENPYNVGVYVYDDQNAVIGSQSTDFGPGVVSNGQWQVTVDIQSGRVSPPVRPLRAESPVSACRRSSSTSASKGRP
jgi:hypothetical protein